MVHLVVKFTDMFGYADESGEPGVKKNNNDYFIFCIVILNNKNKVLELDEKINMFRINNNYSYNHEFHYSTDSKITRKKFTNFLSGLEFGFISVSIKKDSHKETASFANIARLVLEILKSNSLDISIIMDTNPRLCKELRVRKKYYNNSLHFSERKSRGNNLIQLADYVTAIRARYIKYPNRQTSVKMYSSIKNKLLDEINIQSKMTKEPHGSSDDTGI